MSATKGYGCREHPAWSSVMVPIWLGWLIPRLHLWVHEHTARHDSADPVRCPKCGGPHPFHDPACVVHPDLIQDHMNGRSER